MAVDAATWAEIRRRFEQTPTAITEIAKSFSVGRSTIYEKSRTEGWAARPKFPPATEPPRALDASTAPPQQPAEPRTPDTPEARMTRLFRLVDLQLDKLENRMTSAEPLTAEDEARLTRTYNTIVTNLEKVTEAASTQAKSGEQAHGETRGDRHLKAEQLRQEIAERLERLNAQWNAPAKSE